MADSRADALPGTGVISISRLDDHHADGAVVKNREVAKG
jgi:hypothetical protein